MFKKGVSLKVFIIRRLLQLLPMILIVMLLNFTLVHIAPGDPAVVMAGELASEEYLENIREKYGLNKPLHEQLIIYVSSVFRGDLGYSFTFHMPVSNLLLLRAKNTLLLMGVQLVFSVLFGIFLGVISAKKAYSLKDNAITLISLIGYSLPAFWLSMLLVLVFSVKLGLFPSQGMTSLINPTSWENAIDTLYHLFLPAIALGIYHLALITRLTRANMLEVLRKDFIVTARAKGLGENEVVYRHGLRNALLPLVTVTGMNIGRMLAGATLTETVFAWPGLGRLIYDSILSRDYPVIMGQLLFISITVVIANLLTDILYAFLDPRIRY